MRSSDQGKATTVLPRYVRVLCIITLLLLAGSALFELWVMLSPWFRGEAFPTIAEGYRQNVAELQFADLPATAFVWLTTLLLDLLSFIPYYTALLLAALLFSRFYRGRIWSTSNIRLLKIISLLIIFDAVYPALQSPLQILLFLTDDGHRHLVVGVGFSSEAIRSFIVGFSVYVFSVVIDKARSLDDEIQLIV